MRIFIVYEDTRLTVDIKPGDKVKALKDIVESKLLVNIQEDKKQEKILDLMYGGASLRDEWIMQDIGITSGSTIKSALKVVEKPKLCVLLGYSGEMFNIMADINPITTTIHDIRYIISRKLGLPVASFRLCLMSSSVSSLVTFSRSTKNPKVIELYDCNTLQYYGLDVGDTVKLDVWDGWMEFIKAALLGHEKLVDQYLSWEEEERHFQRRVALQIAAHFGHVSLAQAMLKAGARPDHPVGTHPTREWCSGSEHTETKKCPVHEACECGNLGILRMCVKNNILCFVVRDGKGRTPWQIVIEHWHKDCFEYLLARQWGRKSGKDISLPLLTYCRVLQWCERARARVLMLYGTSKSTLRGRPIKQGALVGSGVVVDGLNGKNMSSKPLSAMPKPTINPRRLLPALARARRRFRRQRSSVVFHESSNSQWSSNGSGRPPLSRRTSSKISLTQRPSPPLSIVEDSLEYKSKKDSMKKISINQKNTKIERKGRLSKSSNAMYISTGVTSKSTNNNEKGESFALPPINPAEVPGNERIHRTRSSRVFKESVTTWDDNSSRSAPDTNKTGNKENQANGDQMNNKVRSLNRPNFSSIPLPSTAIPEYKKPFFYWGAEGGGGDENPIEVTLSRFETYRGMQSRDNAIQCLTLTNTFTEKPWLKQLDMAICLACRCVTKNLTVENASS